ncbi:hypothetical protein PYI73_10780 [Staphylococcus epidermidis]|nr:hypothetical protein [Staphylococcus epidermidis]
MHIILTLQQNPKEYIPNNSDVFVTAKTIQRDNKVDNFYKDLRNEKRGEDRGFFSKLFTKK